MEVEDVARWVAVGADIRSPQSEDDRQQSDEGSDPVRAYGHETTTIGAHAVPLRFPAASRARTQNLSDPGGRRGTFHANDEIVWSGVRRVFS